MRLVRTNQNADEDLFSLCEFNNEEELPPFAILSHMWSPEEVTYNGLTNQPEHCESKERYAKFLFCLRQAEYDGFEYFHMDTCCINPANNMELQTVINSMFRWFNSASKCYVFLSDVSAHGRATTTFFRSRWFTRA